MRPQLKETILPTLDFNGKSIIYSYHLGVPLRYLKIDEAKSLAAEDNAARQQPPSLDDNLIIHGDNLHALKALLPRYEGRIKCIYIDPPYNTDNEGWKYIRADDLERHDKWLCMMWPRLQLLKALLSDDGVILVSIDDNESHRLKCLMDEIFKEYNYLVTYYIQLRYPEKTLTEKSDYQKVIEQVLVYKKSSFIPTEEEATEGKFYSRVPSKKQEDTALSEATS